MARRCEVAVNIMSGVTRVDGTALKAVRVVRLRWSSKFSVISI